MPFVDLADDPFAALPISTLPPVDFAAGYALDAALVVPVPPLLAEAAAEIAAKAAAIFGLI